MGDKLNEVVLKDCVEGIKSISDRTFDIIIADPPYNIGKDFGNDSDSMDFDHYVQWSELWMKECVRVLKDSGTMFIYGFDENLAYLSVKLPRTQQRWLTWYYTNKTTPKANFWGRSHESIICFWKDKNKRVFNLDNVRVPYTEMFLTGAAGTKRAKTVGRFSNGEKETTYNAHPKGAMPRDVIEIGTIAGRKGSKEKIFIQKENGEIVKHPTQKPLELTKRLLDSCKTEGCNLLVPFAGSGSECYMAKKMNIDFLAFEINKDYVDLANKFISQ